MPEMSMEDLDLDIPLEEREDPQVAFWRDEYGMWVDELEATLSGERDFMFEDDLAVHSFMPTSLGYNLLNELQDYPIVSVHNGHTIDAHILNSACRKDECMVHTHAIPHIRPTDGHHRSPCTTCACSKGGRMRAGKWKRCMHAPFRVSDRLTDTPGARTRRVQARRAGEWGLGKRNGACTHRFACPTDSRTPQEPVHNVCRLEGPAN